MCILTRGLSGLAFWWELLVHAAYTQPHPELDECLQCSHTRTNILIFLPKIIPRMCLNAWYRLQLYKEILLPRLDAFTSRAFYSIVLRLTKVSRIMHKTGYSYRANTPSSLGCIIKNDLHKFLTGPVHFTVGFTVALKCNPDISAVLLCSCELCKKKKKKTQENVESFY